MEKVLQELFWAPIPFKWYQNNLDAALEDYLKSNNLFALIGDEMVDFRKELMSQNSIKTSKEVICHLILPKGVKQEANVGGSELLDCEGEEISL